VYRVHEAAMLLRVQFSVNYLEANATPSQCRQVVLCVEIVRLTLSFASKCEEPRVAKLTFKEKNKVGSPTLSDFKTYKAIITKME
jgi:hypothetical protein